MASSKHETPCTCCEACRIKIRNQAESLRLQAQALRDTGGKPLRQKHESEVTALRAQLVVQEQAALRWHGRAIKLAKILEHRFGERALAREILESRADSEKEST